MAAPSTGLLSDQGYHNLKHDIITETTSHRKKVDILFDSRGHMRADQVSGILRSLQSPVDKLRAIKILSPRLCRMSCSEGGDIISSINIHNDKLTALSCIKRALTDSQSRYGKEEIISAFPYEEDKLKALRILHTVRSDVYDKIPAGGHQGYGAVGGLCLQSRPLSEHLYGPLHEQLKRLPGQGQIKIPPTARPGVIPSVYTGHPSYAYPTDTSYHKTSHYPPQRCSTAPRGPPLAASATVTGSMAFNNRGPNELSSHGDYRRAASQSRSPWPAPPERFTYAYPASQNGYNRGLASGTSRPMGAQITSTWSTPPMKFEHVFSRGPGLATPASRPVSSLAPGTNREF